MTRVTRSQRGQTIITLLASIGIGLSTMPPGVGPDCVFVFMRGRDLVCRLAMLTPEMTTESVRLLDRRASDPLLLAVGIAQDALDLAVLAGILAVKNHDGVAGPDLRNLGGRSHLDLGHHRTSGARETIFM